MDDSGWTWPAWKFGMKRDDLFTKLHDQYNIVPSAIQDPEAFHHDVFEISSEASTADEFHRLMAQRKEERLMELNDLLESTALQIISNPDLITSDQWEFAVQLFRTKSFDSLVRYFASYLPGDWHHSPSDASISDSDSVSNDSIADSHQSGPSFFDDKPLMAEPNAMQSYLSTHLPPSPRSMTMCSDDSAAVDLIHHKYVLTTLTPSRTLSCSGSEPERFRHDDDASQASDPDTPISSIMDVSETHREVFLNESLEVGAHPKQEYSTHDQPTDEELFTSETPTPKPESHMTCFLEAKLSPLSSSSSALRHRSMSPSRAYPLVHAGTGERRKLARIQRRDVSPPGRGSRRGNYRLDETRRVHKPLPEAHRSRFRGRRVLEDEER